MKKIIIILLFFVCVIASFAQNKTLINPPTGTKNTITHYADGFGMDSALALPSTCGRPDTAYFHRYSTKYRHGYIIMDTCNNTGYWFNPFNDSILVLGSGGSGGSGTLQDAWDNSVIAGQLNPVINTTTNDFYVRGTNNNHRIVSTNTTSGLNSTLQINGAIDRIGAFVGSNDLSVYSNRYHTGLPTGLNYVLTDSSGFGDLVMRATGASFTASNGDTLLGTDIQIGGTLTHNTSIQTSIYGLTIQSNASAVPLQTSSQNNIAFNATTITGLFAGGFNVLPGVADTTYSLIRLTNSGNANVGANGIGGSIDYVNATTTTAQQLSNRLISSWTDATNASRTSQFSITGVNNTVQSTLFTLNGNGETILDKYGQGDFTTGTPAYQLAVTATGNIIETSVAAATVRVDSVTLDFSGYNADTTFTLTQSGFKNLEIQAEQEQAGGFQQDFNDTQGILKWQVALKGSYKFFITYYY